MQLSKVFTIVVVLHLGVIGILLIQPGCKTKSENQVATAPPQQPMGSEATGLSQPTRPATSSPAQPTGTTSFQSNSAPSVHPDFNAGLTASDEPLPVNESWNIVEESEPETILPEPEVLKPIPQDKPSIINEELAVMQTQTYSVVKGDNLTKIAKKFDVSLGDLMKANTLNRKSVLNIGQVLVIPADGSAGGPTAPPAPSFVSTDPVDVAGTTYIVVPGDSLSKIASKFGTTVDSIKSVNGLKGNTIYAGQNLLVPPGKKPVKTTTARAIPASTTFSAPGAGDVTYKVKSGETLGAIARRFKTDVDTIMRRNGIDDPRKLRAGQTLIIGDAKGQAATPAPVPAVNSLTSRTKPTPTVEAEPIPAPEPTMPAETEASPLDVFEDVDIDSVPVVPVENTSN